MKKILFWGITLACATVFTACHDNHKPSHDIEVLSGSYRFADYTTAPAELNGTETANVPVKGGAYVDWQFTGDDRYPEFLAAVLRYAGSALLPQTMNGITLDADGGMSIAYVEEPAIKGIDMSSFLSVFLGNGFPGTDDVTKNFARSGFADSPKNLARWSVSNGTVLVTLDLKEIIALKTDAVTAEALYLTIESVLNSEPAAVKELAASFLGESVKGIQDATVSQLQEWLKKGIPLQTKFADDRHTCLYLDKTAFDNLLTPRATGETDWWGDPVMTSDLQIVWNALIGAGIVPAEAQGAAILFDQFGKYWSATTGFALGLELIKR